MSTLNAALWGLTGGLSNVALALMMDIIGAGFTWPWRRKQVGPHLFVGGCTMLLGAAVAAAAAGQMSGPWPAFVIGIGAPSTVKGMLAGVQVLPKPVASAPRRPDKDREGSVGERAQ
jgi:hypothetical protein